MSAKNIPVDWDVNAIGKGADFSRFALLGALLQRHVQNGSILDVGCDTGKLNELVGNARYVGIDARSEAIETAKQLFPHSHFICARADEWIPEQAFDAVVFNESLYYLDDFAGALEKFYHCLCPGGVLALSIYEHPRWFTPNAQALKTARHFIGRFCEKVHDITITSDGMSWNILLARKHSEATQVELRA